MRSEGILGKIAMVQLLELVARSFSFGSLHSFQFYERLNEIRVRVRVSLVDCRKDRKESVDSPIQSGARTKSVVGEVVR